jgi:predicted metal-dependent peptidase
MYDKDPEIANASCDFNINGKLVDENKKPDYRINGRMEQFATMPTNDDGERIGLFDEKYRVKDGWMDSSAIFKQLYKERRGGGGTGTGAGDDDTTANQNVKEGGSEVTDGQPSNSLPQGFDEHDWEGAQKIPTEEQKKNVREIDEALRQGAMAAGKMGSGGNRSLEELLAPQVDWNEVMRAFVNDVCKGNHFSTWKRPNRRYIGANIFMPSGISETVEDLVCNMDMSLSIQQWHVTLFLSELADLCETVRPNRVRLLYWDTQVCSEEIYEGEEIDSIRTSTKPKGGGGTDVRCVTNYYKEHDIRPTASIVFTDGYLGGVWGDWDTPLLWCLLNNKAAKPPIGSYVHIDESKL